MIINQIQDNPKNPPVCIYVAVGQKESKVAKIVETLKNNNAFSYTIVVSASALQARLHFGIWRRLRELPLENISATKEKMRLWFMTTCQNTLGHTGKFLCFCEDRQEEKHILETCFICIQDYWKERPNFQKKKAEAVLLLCQLLKHSLATLQ